MSTIAALLFPALSAEPQGGAAQPAFDRRGAEVEARRGVLQARLAALRAAILDTLAAQGADLVATLDPAPPPVRRGYRLLPRLVGDPPRSDIGSITTRYSWTWTDTLISRGMGQADSVLGLTRLGPKGRADLQRLVADFNALAAHRRLIDTHIEHNWLWQRTIARDPARFAAATRAIEAITAGRSPILPLPAAPTVEIIPEETPRGGIRFRVPMATDIEDTAFVRSVQSRIEALWSGVAASRHFAIVLDIHFISPHALYCPDAAPTCRAPAAGSAIDLPTHLARFPAGRAVLTTGGTQPHVIGGRAIILGPRDISARTLGHEFGHVLGFDDAYLRGSRDLGPDGFAIVELVPDRMDIMASPGFGSTLPRHFEQLAANVRADRAMKAGLDAMYQKGDPARAVTLFREVLSYRDDHYGATFQLARALDRSGDSTAAVPVWKRMLELAIKTNDIATATTVRTRLGKP